MKKWNGFQKGINLGGWYSQCDYSKDRLENFIQEEDFKRIADWGMDHVRVPVDYNIVEREEGDYIEEGFAYIERAIRLCEKYGLNMILDLHKTAGYSFDPGEAQSGFFEDEALQERFYKLWEEFAKRYSANSFVAFELLNEITLPSFMPAWNRIASTCIARIRAIAPTTDILVGGYWNNSVHGVTALELPEDPHVIYNFHSYDPLIFTHQKAPWVHEIPQDLTLHFNISFAEFKAEYESHGIDQYFGPFPQLPDMDAQFNDSYFEMIFAKAIEFADKKNVALYCGEYGVIDLADAEDALLWYRCIQKVLKKYGIGSAAWTYRSMNFGLTDEHYASVRDGIIAAIVE